jgi:hypothetical protein
VRQYAPNFTFYGAAHGLYHERLPRAKKRREIACQHAFTSRTSLAHGSAPGLAGQQRDAASPKQTVPQ